jgi:hypothetical protein
MASEPTISAFLAARFLPRSPVCVAEAIIVSDPPQRPMDEKEAAAYLKIG